MIRYQPAQTQGDARLIQAFSKKRKDYGYALMAEHSVFHILFISPTKTADSVSGWVMRAPSAMSAPDW
jgi:hypothetical protein